MKTKSYDIWLGKENSDLVNDIKAVLSAKTHQKLRGYNYELRLASTVRLVNYCVSKTSTWEEPGSQKEETSGVVKKFEDPKGVILEIDLLTDDVITQETVGR